MEAAGLFPHKYFFRLCDAVEIEVLLSVSTSHEWMAAGVAFWILQAIFVAFSSQKAQLSSNLLFEYCFYKW